MRLSTTWNKPIRNASPGWRISSTFHILISCTLNRATRPSSRRCTCLQLIDALAGLYVLCQKVHELHGHSHSHLLRKLPVKKFPRRRTSGSGIQPRRPPRFSRELAILYEDDAVVAVNKPAGLLAVPAPDSDAL